MGLLEKALVRHLLDLSSQEKQDRVEVRIVQLIGGTQGKKVSNLPPRRGRADGGLDGTVRVHVPNDLLPTSRKAGIIDIDAALNIKIRKSKFTRDQLGAFVNDMDRENILVGIIISASGLSADAKSELERHNKKGSVHLAHVLLEDLISNAPILEGIQFRDGNLRETVKKGLENFISSENR
jgi:hypothetical protein